METFFAGPLKRCKKRYPLSIKHFKQEIDSASCVSETKEHEDGDTHTGKLNMPALSEIEHDSTLESTENNLAYECFFVFVYINHHPLLLD